LKILPGLAVVQHHDEGLIDELVEFRGAPAQVHAGVADAQLLPGIGIQFDQPTLGFGLGAQGGPMRGEGRFQANDVGINGGCHLVTLKVADSSEYHYTDHQ
jgi:hypothetical protein